MLALRERGVTVTSHSTSDKYDFISRYFAPWVGINEDPVNGSSHCALAPFWAKALGKQQLKAYQASQRSGELDLELLTDRVHISGKAITIMQGQLLV
jgi:predicted PhzF superfamily epimerase YddE/YHI9